MTDDARGPAPITLAMLLGTLFGLTAMSASALAVALPALAEDLDLSRSTSAWVMSCYALTLAVTTALHGRIADLVGIRIPFVAGVCLMATGAVVSALAPSLGVLLAARLVQGAGAAAIPVLATDLLSHRFEGSVRNEALGRLAGMAGACSALGPLVGGVLEEAGSWRLSAAVPALALLLLPVVWVAAPSSGSGGRLDLRGAAFVAASGAGLMLVVQSPGAGALAGAIGFVVLVAGVTASTRHIRARPDGFLPVSILRNRVVMASALATGSCPVAWFALLIAVPLLLSDRGWSSLEIGLGLIPSVVIAIAVSRIAGGLLERLGASRVLTACTTIAAAALLTAATAVGLGSPPLLLASVALVTVAFGIGQPAMVSAVGGAVDPAIRGIALGVATFLFLVGAGVGSAALGGLPALLGTGGTFCLLALIPLAGAVAVRRFVPLAGTGTVGASPVPAAP